MSGSDSSRSNDGGPKIIWEETGNLMCPRLGSDREEPQRIKSFLFHRGPDSNLRITSFPGAQHRFPS